MAKISGTGKEVKKMYISAHEKTAAQTATQKAKFFEHGEEKTERKISETERKIFQKEKSFVLENLSESVREILKKTDLDRAEEIRLRKNKPLTLQFGQKHVFVCQNGAFSADGQKAYIVSGRDIERTLELLCRGGIYSFREQIGAGYITMQGGHRVGIAGSAVVKDGKVTYLKDISGLNIRIARCINGAADSIMSYLAHNASNGKIQPNILIVSPPGCGKTTILRDLARQMSENGVKVVIIDERSEIAAMSDGTDGCGTGVLTDILDACPKAEGMMMAIRSLSPQIIVCDEVGSKEDIEAIGRAADCGVGVAASIHASNARELFNSQKLRECAEMFDIFVTLSMREGSGTVESILTREQIMHGTYKNGRTEGIRYA